MKRLPRFLLLPAILAALQFPAAQAYGPLGHEIVGAIADERLANTPAATTDLLWKKPPSLPTRSKAGTRRALMIQGLFITQRIGTSTGNCAISGEQIRHHPAQIQARLRIIGSTTPMFPSCRRNDTVMGALAAANGT